LISIKRAPPRSQRWGSGLGWSRGVDQCKRDGLDCARVPGQRSLQYLWSSRDEGKTL